MKNYENQYYYICLIKKEHVKKLSNITYKDFVYFLSNILKVSKSKIIKEKTYYFFKYLQKGLLFHGEYFNQCDITKGKFLFSNRYMDTIFKENDFMIFEKSDFVKICIQENIDNNYYQNINADKFNIIIFRNYS